MFIKHQQNSYRTRKGKRFVCVMDCCEGDVRAEAAKAVAVLRKHGKAAFFETHPDGYSRVFVEEPAK